MATPKRNVAQYQAFIEWEATPNYLKEELTLEQYAQKIGVDRVTLSRWRQTEGHWEEVTKCYNKYHSTKVLKVRDKLMELTQGVECVKYDKDGKEIVYEKPPDVKAIELFLKYEDKWMPTEKTEVTGEIKVKNIKAEQTSAMAEQVLLKARQKATSGKSDSK